MTKAKQMKKKMTVGSLETVMGLLLLPWSAGHLKAVQSYQKGISSKGTQDPPPILTLTAEIWAFIPVLIVRS